MAIHLIPTKIIIPKRAPGVIRRQRLIDFLHENLERRLVLVTAPAGYGKTTLLVDFANDVDFPVYWYTLDEGDRDPSTFVAHLVAAIRQKYPKFGERSTSLSESGMLSARAMAGALAADMVNDVPEYFVLILDDWHLVGEETSVRDLLDHLLRYLPEHAHLIVAGRTLPRGPLVRLAAQDAVAGLGSNDLRFTATEVRELLAKRYDLHITDEQAVKLIAESEGWISGILLTSQNMWRGLLAGLIHAADSGGTLYDYLAGEVFDHLSLPLRRFLLESAVPRQFTAPMCDEVRGVPGSGVWIDQVEARSLFLTRVVADGETWYRYHHLFREFLLTRFQRGDAAGFARLQLRAGEWFEARQQPEESVEHYLASGAPERAARVMDAHARGLFRAGRIQTLLRWVELLPAELHAKAPELVLFQGQALLERGRPAEALPVLEKAEAAFRARGDALGQIRSTLLQGWSHYARGKSHDALAVGETVLQQLDAVQLGEPVLQAEALRLVGASYNSMGRWQNGETCLTQALALHRRSNSDDRRAFNLGRVLQDLANALRSQGRLEEAASLQSESLALWREIGNPGLLAASLNNVGYDRFLVGDYEGALKFYAEAMARAEEADDRRSRAYLLESVAAAHRDAGRFQRAIEIYQEAFDAANTIGDQWLVSWLLDGFGHAHRLAGHLDRASALFAQARHLAEREGNHSLVILATASSGIAQVEQGRAAEGTAELERAVADLRKSESSLDLARVQFWLARAYNENGQPALAKENLVQVLKLGERFGCRPFSLAEGRRAAAFVAWGADESGPASRLRAWLDELQVEVAPALAEARPEPVTPPRIEVRALGAGSVYRDGRLITLQEWGGSATARELFFHLLDRSPQHKQQIGHVFWPDHSPAKMTTVFHAVKYKARRALGVEFVVYRDDRYEIDPAAGIWYDVAEFERLLDAAQRRADDDPQRLTELQQAVKLYAGDFLTNVYSDWATERRHALQARYFEAVQQLLDVLLRRQQFEQALELCQRGIEFDYYREDLHRAIISSLAEIGRRAEALLHYRALARRFRRELRASPAQETRDLVVRIRSPR